MNFASLGVMNTSKLARATFVLSKSVKTDLDYLSQRIGQSRSSLVRDVLEPAVTEMAALLRTLPDQPDADQVDMFVDRALSRVDGVASGLREDFRRG
jgi:predicted transcriptional regulator